MQKRYTSSQLKNLLNIQVLLLLLLYIFCSCARFGGHQNLESYRVNKVQI
jgi:hypothetical protein